MSERSYYIAKIFRKAEQVVQDVRVHSVEGGHEEAIDTVATVRDMASHAHDYDIGDQDYPIG